MRFKRDKRNKEERHKTRQKRYRGNRRLNSNSICRSKKKMIVWKQNSKKRDNFN